MWIKAILRDELMGNVAKEMINACVNIDLLQLGEGGKGTLTVQSYSYQKPY